MKTKFALLVLFALPLLLGACNKEERFSKRLSKGEIWRVEYVRVNGVDIDFKGEWHIQSDVQIYEDVPTLEWRVDTMDAFFEWQFQDKGKVFQLNYNQLCAEAEGSALDTLDYVGYDITGTYNVERHGRNRMEFAAYPTLGFPYYQVKIAIERIK